jgi:hypothetical protein
MHFKTIQPDNPILRAEISYQQRTIPRWLQWFDRFGVIILALIISLALMYFLLKNIGFVYASIGQEILTIILPLLWITQLVVIFRSLLAGVNVMQHYRGQQWDIFVLAGITTQQFFLIKFWTVLYKLRGWILAFGIIKLAVVCLISANAIFDCYLPPLTYPYLRSDPLYWVSFCGPRLPTTDRIIWVGALSIAITVLEVVASTAIGIVAGFIHNRGIGFFVATFVRLIPVCLFSIFPDYPSASGKVYWRWFEYTTFSLADGGNTGILRSVDYFRHHHDPNTMTQSVLLAFWAAIIMYIAYLVFAFLISHFLLRRQGMLSATSK